MALIKCEDCGKDVSNKAKACIHCGCPIEIKKEEKKDDDLEIDVVRSECDDRAVMIWLMVMIVGCIICMLTVVGILLLPLFAYMIYYTITSKKEYVVVTTKRIHGINWGLKKEKVDIPISKVSKVTAKTSMWINSVEVKTADGKNYTFDYLTNAKEISEAFSNVKK